MTNFKIISLDSTESTNGFLKSNINQVNYRERTIILAQEQTQGKGQQGNSWESEKGKNLTFSILLKPLLQAAHMFMVSKAVSLAIIDTLNYTGKQFKIKWPNDIYYNDHKIAGILIENQLLGSNINYSIIGIGLNVNQKKFKSNAPNPISLNQIFEKEFDHKELLNYFLLKLDYWYQLLNNGDFESINQQYLSNCYRLKGYHKYSHNGEVFEAKIIDIAEDGQLSLETNDSKKLNFYFKEVEFCMPI